MNEHEIEPVPGLPEELPPGERLLWQGAPSWPALARRALHVNKVAFWFAILIAVQLSVALSSGVPVTDAAKQAVWLALLGAVAVGLLALLARAFARSTLYSITNRRVVMRFGVAIPITLNLPFPKIASAALRTYRDGSGNIPLQLVPGEKVSYWVLWPHARPWHFAPAQPMLRAIPDARQVAELLADALEASPAKQEGAAAGSEPAPERTRQMAAA